MDAMLAWTNTRTAAPKSALGKAFTYLKDQWPSLLNYLKDGRLELSNNRAKRSMNPFVIDRKNFLFANTPSGTKGSAVIFSLIQTVIENKLDPYRYLTWSLSTVANLDLTCMTPCSGWSAVPLYVVRFVAYTINEKKVKSGENCQSWDLVLSQLQLMFAGRAAG